MTADLIHYQSLKRGRFRTPVDFVQRRSPRFVCSFDTKIRLSNGRGAVVSVLNFSEGGFMLASDPGLPSGARFEILLPSFGYRAAQALWSSGLQFGGTFEAPIIADQLIEALENRGLIAAA